MTHRHARSFLFAAGLGLSLTAPAPAQVTTRFVAQLSGAAVPGPCGTPVAGAGVAVAYLHELTNVLVVAVSVTGVAGTTIAHLHAGAPGVCGALIATLNGGGGSWPDRVVLTPAQVTALRAGDLYVDVHTSAAPGGQIRGPLLGDDPAEFSADLTAIPGIPTAGHGHACFELLPDGRLAYILRTDSLVNATSANINLGTVPFTLSGGPVVWIGITPGTVSAGGLANLRASLVDVTVNTVVNTSGEIRGRLQPRRRPYVFGTTCPSSSGIPAEINATSLACVGDTYRLEIYRAGASVPMILVLGFSSLNGIPFGPGCQFYLDLGILLMIPAGGTSPSGYGHYNVPVPYDRTLLGAVLDAQWLTIDAAVAGSVAASNGLRAVIQ